jgi:hypothetical protein
MQVTAIVTYAPDDEVMHTAEECANIILEALDGDPSNDIVSVTVVVTHPVGEAGNVHVPPPLPITPDMTIMDANGNPIPLPPGDLIVGEGTPQGV